MPAREYRVDNRGYRKKWCRNCFRRFYREQYHRNGKKQPVNLTGEVSYKRALPPELWPKARLFVARFIGCALAAERAGVEPDVSAFLTEYRKAVQG